MNAFAKSCFDVMQTYGFDVSISSMLSSELNLIYVDRASISTGNTPSQMTAVENPQTRKITLH